MKKMMMIATVLSASIANAQVGSTKHTCSNSEGQKLEVEVDLKANFLTAKLVSAGFEEVFNGAPVADEVQTFNVVSQTTGQVSQIKFAHPKDHGNACGRCAPQPSFHYYAKLITDNQTLDFTCSYF